MGIAASISRNIVDLERMFEELKRGEGTKGSGLTEKLKLMR